jgi:endonuclease YncB( thermonuclease family)
MPTPATNRFQKLVDNIARIYTNARRAQVRFAWETGRLIIEEEQNGQLRAEYGVGLLEKLSKALREKYGEGFSKSNLLKMRRFYLLNQKESVPTQLDWTDYVELLPIKDEHLRRRIERRVMTENLSSQELRRLVRKTREDRGEEIRDVSSVSFSGPQEALVPKRGTPYTYRLVKRPKLGAGKDDALLLDLGFGIFKRLSARNQSRFAQNQIIESQWDDAQEIYSFKTSERTAKDLFTYQAVVERVIDGDTLKVRVDLGFDLEHRETLRLRGIDAPEMSNKAGEAAKAFVLSILKEADTITIYTSRSDKYDRYLADVFAASDSGEVFVNNLLLERGHAKRMKE